MARALKGGGALVFLRVCRPGSSSLLPVFRLALLLPSPDIAIALDLADVAKNQEVRVVEKRFILQVFRFWMFQRL